MCIRDRESRREASLKSPICILTRAKASIVSGVQSISCLLYTSHFYKNSCQTFFSDPYCEAEKKEPQADNTTIS